MSTIAIPDCLVLWQHRSAAATTTTAATREQEKWHAHWQRDAVCAVPLDVQIRVRATPTSTTPTRGRCATSSLAGAATGSRPPR
eukprot:COSAG01_NODE_10623_length_2119_cov_0.802475_1_plen_84_part_00